MIQKQARGNLGKSRALRTKAAKVEQAAKIAAEAQKQAEEDARDEALMAEQRAADDAGEVDDAAAVPLNAGADGGGSAAAAPGGASDASAMDIAVADGEEAMQASTSATNRTEENEKE